MKDGVVNFFNRSGHRVDGINGTNDYRPVVASCVISYADRTEVGNSCEVLPYLACKSVFSKFVAENSVGQTYSFKTVTCDSAKTTYAESGTGERLTVNHIVGKSESCAASAYFVLEEHLEWLNKFKLKVIGKSADIVVRFNCLCGLCSAFDDVRINCTLSKEGNSVKLSCFFFEHTDEFCTDYLSLLLGICNACKLVKEAVGGVNVNEVSTELFAEYLNDLLGLTLTEKTVVYVYAGKLVADSLDKKSGNNRRVNTAGESKKNLAVADLSADKLYLVVYEVFHIPVSFCLAGSGHGIRLQYGVSQQKDPGKDSSVKQSQEAWLATRTAARELQHQKNVVLDVLAKDKTLPDELKNVAGVINDVSKTLDAIESTPRTRIKGEVKISFHLFDQLKSFVNRLVEAFAALAKDRDAWKNEALQRRSEASRGRYVSDFELETRDAKFRAELENEHTKRENLESYLKEQGLSDVRIEHIENGTHDFGAR